MTTTTFDGYCKLTQKDTFLQLQYNHSNHHQRHHDHQNHDYRRHHKRHDLKGTIGRLICQFDAYGWTSKVGTAGIQLLHRTHNRRHQGYHVHNICHKHSHTQHNRRKLCWTNMIMTRTKIGAIIFWWNTNNMDQSSCP